MTTVAINNAKQGLTRIPTYAELIKEIDKDKFKTKEIRDVFDRNAWYFHASPLGGVLRDGVSNSNIHPADLQQQNFQNMVRQATRAEEETKFYDIDDEMVEMRGEAIDDFEMAFDREKAVREESSRRVAEQVKLSHSRDHYKANRGTYDSIKAKPTQSFKEDIPAQSSGSYYSGSFVPHKKEEEQTVSAGILEDEEEPKPSVLRTLASHSKHVIKKVAQVVGKAKGGDIGGVVAEKLADYIVPYLNTESKPKTKVKKSITKPTPMTMTAPKGNKKTTVSMDVDIQENPEMLNNTLKRATNTDRRTKVKMQKPDTTRTTAEKRATDGTDEKTTKTRKKKDNLKTLPAVNVASSPSSSSSSEAPASSSAAPPTQPQDETKPVRKKSVKHHNIDKTPSDTITMQVMLQTLMEQKGKKIDASDFDEFNTVSKAWRKAPRADQEKKKELLNKVRAIYRNTCKKISG